MRTFIATALIATMAAAESDIFAKEEMLVRHLATGSKVEATAKRPNASARTEADCTDLNDNTDSIYYEYVWNTEGCFCAHTWKEDGPYVAQYWANCDLTDGTILNPYHEINNNNDRCLTQEEYDACEDFNSCVAVPPTPPTPPIEECNVAFGVEGEPTGYASAYIQHNDFTEDGNMYEGTGFETGWITFNESCGMGSMCGVDYCIGTCVEGEIWGLRNESGDGTDKFGISINEFGVLDNSASQTGETGVCGQTGTVWNPEEVAHGIPTDAIYPPGALGNVSLSAFVLDIPVAPSQCFAQSFSHCAAPGELKVADLMGRSIVIRSAEDLGAGTDPDTSAAYDPDQEYILACGTIGNTRVNPSLVSLPIDATSDGTPMFPGSTLCSEPGP